MTLLSRVMVGIGLCVAWTNVAVAERTRAPTKVTVVNERIDAAREALDRAHFIKAERIFESVLELDPTSRAALEGAAEAAFENAHYFKALVWAERAVAIAPTTKNYVQLGHASMKLGQFDRAAVAYGKALGILPEDTDLQERVRVAKQEADSERRARTVLTSGLTPGR